MPRITARRNEEDRRDWLPIDSNPSRTVFFASTGQVDDVLDRLRPVHHSGNRHRLVFCLLVRFGLFFLSSVVDSCRITRWIRTTFLTRCACSRVAFYGRRNDFFLWIFFLL